MSAVTIKLIQVYIPPTNMMLLYINSEFGKKKQKIFSINFLYYYQGKLETLLNPTTFLTKTFYKTQIKTSPPQSKSKDLFYFQLKHPRLELSIY